MISTSHTDVHIKNMKEIHIQRTRLGQLMIEFGWLQVQGLTIYMTPEQGAELAILLKMATDDIKDLQPQP